MRRSDFKANNIRDAKDRDVSKLWAEADQSFIGRIYRMLQRGKYVCHVFTEDPCCENLIQDEFRHEVQHWKVTMPPPQR